MDQEDNFYTLKGYSLLEHVQITYSMEDYLEMICRLSQDGTPVRIGDLAKCLHVRPSSASKMAGNLRSSGLVRFEKYGTVTLTEAGLQNFFCYINQTTDELEQAEKVEHFIDPKTVYNLKKWLDKFT